MIESVDIKDIQGNIRFSTSINEGSKRKFLLMKEDYITLKFSLDEPVYFNLGDYIDNELGMFELVDLYKPVYNTSTGGYDYELRLDAYYWKWKNKKFFYTPETTGREASWNLTAPLETHLEIFIANLKALGYKFREDEFTPKIDGTVENASKLVSYDNVNLIDALTQMAETWECEWWIENHNIRFGRCEFSSPVDFKLGDLNDTEGVNVNSMQRSDSQTTYATRVYAFGSTRNIPSTYRKDLIFDANVDGRYISDSERVLKEDFFPLSSKINPAPLFSVYASRGFDYTSSKYEPKLLLSEISTLLMEGRTLTFDLSDVEIKLASRNRDENYNFTPVNINIDIYIRVGKRGPISDDKFIMQSLKNFSVVAVGDGTTLIPPLGAFEANVEGEISVIQLLAEIYNADGTAYYGRFDIYIKGNCIVWQERIRYKTSITFLSGINQDQQYDCFFFPDVANKQNVIQIPENVVASNRDRYTIGNIIKGKVPDKYFSKDDKELTLNGVVQKRLMLPDGIPYVDAYRYSPTGERIDIGDEHYDDPDNVEMSAEEAIEEIVTFEDEYPKYTGSTVEVPEPRIEKEIDEETEEPTGNEYPVYTFKDTELKNFNKDSCLAEFRIIFQTGKLAGLDFALIFKESDDTGTTFEIVRNEDYGRYLPDDTLFPQAAHQEDGKDVPADTYILHGFDTAFISEQMLPDAEGSLLEKAKEYVKKSMIDPSTYDCEMDSTYIYNGGKIRTFTEGDKVNLINKAYFENVRQSRIIGYEWPLDIPYDHPVYTVGETAAYSRIGEIESKIDSLTYKGQTYGGSVVGGGGTSVYVVGVNDKTLPSDRNVFSARRALNEFISKKNDDTVAGVITFLKRIIALLGINIGEAIDSLTSGKGTLLRPDGSIQADRLELRSSLTVLELIFNRLSAQEGDATYSESGVIESVDLLENGTYRLPLRKRFENDFTAFDWNDIVYGSVNDLATGGGNYHTSWMRIVGVNTVENYIEAVLYPDAEVPGGKNYPPEPLMAITRRGNTSDEERQSYWYISSYEKCICMLDGVTSPILREDNYSVIIGKMKNLSLFDNLPINYRQSYIYCRGLIRQDDIRVDVTGKPIYEFVNRGIWSLSVAQSEPYLFESKNPITGTNETSTVYHRGMKWQCLSSGTLLEPKWNSTDWAFLEGNGEFSIDFESSKGFSFFYGLIDTVIEAKFYHGTVDITEDVMSTPGTLITWSRDTGIPAEDNSWSPVFADDRKNKIHLLSGDMGSQWLNARSVTFKVEAVIPLGEENYLRKSEELQFNL